MGLDGSNNVSSDVCLVKVSDDELRSVEMQLCNDLQNTTKSHNMYNDYFHADSTFSQCRFRIFSIRRKFISVVDQCDGE